MAAFAVCQERLSRQHSMLDSNRFDDDLGALDEPVGLARRVRAELAFDHHRKLDEVRYAHPTCGRGGDQLDETRAPRLAIEDGRSEERRVGEECVSTVKSWGSQGH